MNEGHTGFNPSSIIDLKAELQKKYDKFKRDKSAKNVGVFKRTLFKSKGDEVKKEKAVVPPKPEEGKDDEELALKKSRLALEAKARLYQQMTSSDNLVGDEENNQFLVDFQRKVLYGENQPDRIIDTKIDTSTKIENKSYLTTTETPKGKSELKSDGSVHYQDVQFDERRDHGTGYFAFSTDETKRKEQMEELNVLRQETEEQRLARQKLQRKRKIMLESRLAKICERRNINQDVVEKYTAKLVNEDETNIPPIDVASIPLPETTKPETVPKMPVKVRPWDIGKVGVQFPLPFKKNFKSQEQWVEERREEREAEFAPPSCYS